MTGCRTWHRRLFVSFPEELVDRPMIYEIDQALRRRAEHPARERRGAFRLDDPRARGRGGPRDAGLAYLEEQGCTVNRMEGDVVAG